jgi:RNA polymerase sigma factor (sigma-70 family)
MQSNHSLIQTQFEEIFREHWARINRLLVRLLDDEAEAEDLTLDVFIRLYNNASKWKDEINIGGWLTTTAVHLGLNAIRSRKRRQGYEFASGMQWLEENGQIRPLEEIIRQENCQQVRAALAKMDQRQAQLLLLRYSGYSYKEIAQLMGVASSSVGSLLTRAEKIFLEKMKQLE